MRTRSDLEGAFALLERTADAYATSHDDAPADADADTDRAVVELVHPGPSARSHRQRARWHLAAGLTAAAAAVAGVAVVVGQLSSGSGHTTRPADGTASVFDLRSQPVSVARGSGFTLTNLEIDKASVTGELYSRTEHFQFGLDPADAHPSPSTPVRVDINGKRGYYQGDGDPVMHRPAQGSGTGASNAATSGPSAQAVTWEYQPHAWAVLTGQGMPDPGKSALLRAARALRFHDGGTLEVPFRLKAAPMGGELQRIFAETMISTEKPPFRVTDRPTQAEAQYALRDGNFVDVALFTGTQWERSGTPVSVAGQRAYYDKRTHILTVDEGDRRWLLVEVAHDDPTPGKLPPITLQDLATVAKSVRLAPDRSHWFDAHSALP